MRQPMQVFRLHLCKQILTSDACRWKNSHIFGYTAPFSVSKACTCDPGPADHCGGQQNEHLCKQILTSDACRWKNGHIFGYTAPFSVSKACTCDPGPADHCGGQQNKQRPAKRGDRRIERRTSCTQSTNHTTRPVAQVDVNQLKIRV